MKNILRPALVAAAVSLSFAAAPAYAQDSKRPPLQTGETARPADTNANKPSESGAQTTTRAGAATGAGQPQGGAQPADAQAGDSAKAKAKSGSAAKHKQSGKKKKSKHTAKRSNTDAGADAAPSR
jgi:hypothetical protein